MVIDVPNFDWMARPSFSLMPTMGLSLEHRASVNIYLMPDEIESEIKKSEKCQNRPDHRTSNLFPKFFSPLVSKIEKELLPKVRNIGGVSLDRHGTIIYNLAIIKMVAAQRGVDVDKARGPVKLALKKMVASNLVKQLKVGFPFSHLVA